MARVSCLRFRLYLQEASVTSEAARNRLTRIVHDAFNHDRGLYWPNLLTVYPCPATGHLLAELLCPTSAGNDIKARINFIKERVSGREGATFAWTEERIKVNI